MPDVPMDLTSTALVFDKIRGLSINRAGAPGEPNCLVHICTACSLRTLSHMAAEKGFKNVMVPESIPAALTEDQPLKNERRSAHV
jgi:hypothetical protein